MNYDLSLIDIHADDYGLSENNCRTMIECIKRQQLDSISIIPVMDDFDKYMRMLKQAWGDFEKKPKITVHLDLVDGCPLSNKYTPMTWGQLFAASFIPGRARKRLYSRLKCEIRCQIERVLSNLSNDVELRLDSHMHTHMIPIVADAMWEVVDELKNQKKINLSFVRVAREPIAPFIKQVNLWTTYSLINIVKNIILNVLSPRIERQASERNVTYGLLWGLIMSGNMDTYRCLQLFSNIATYATKRGKTIEVLFHPGIVKEKEISDSHNKPEISKFYIDEHRNVELEALTSLKATFYPV